MWKDIYYIFSFNKVRVFVRNQWHYFSSESDLDVLKIGIHRNMNKNLQIHMAIFGFKLVILIKKLPTPI